MVSFSPIDFLIACKSKKNCEGAIQSGEWKLFQYVFTRTKDPMMDKILVDKYKSEEYVTPTYNI